jgi:hypothetical protein
VKLFKLTSRGLASDFSDNYFALFGPLRASRLTTYNLKFNCPCFCRTRSRSSTSTSTGTRLIINTVRSCHLYSPFVPPIPKCDKSIFATVVSHWRCSYSSPRARPVPRNSAEQRWCLGHQLSPARRLQRQYTGTFASLVIQEERNF